MTTLARIGYETLSRYIRDGRKPDEAWEAVARAMTLAVRELDRRTAAITEQRAMRSDLFEREVQRQIQERQK